jgi:hypothetical protein
MVKDSHNTFMHSRRPKDNPCTKEFLESSIQSDQSKMFGGFFNFDKKSSTNKIYDKIRDDEDDPQSKLLDPSYKSYDYGAIDKTVEKTDKKTKSSPIFLEDDTSFFVGPFSHEKKIKLRSTFPFYLRYDKGIAISDFDGDIFTIQVENRKFIFHYKKNGSIVGPNLSNEFEVVDINKTGKYALLCGEKYLGMTVEGRVMLFDHCKLVGTHWVIEDLGIDRSFSVGPFKHGGFVTLQSLANNSLFRYNVNNYPVVDSYSPMVFFVEYALNRKFRLYYWKGYVVTTIRNGYDFEVEMNGTDGFCLNAAEKYLGVISNQMGVVAVYDQGKTLETTWKVMPFDPFKYSVGILHHRQKVKLSSYYWRSHYLKIDRMKPAHLTLEGSIFTVYQVGNCFKFLDGSHSLCTDNPNNDVFVVYQFDPIQLNGYALGTGDPGKYMFLGCARDGRIQLYPGHKFCESRWFIEPAQ